MMRSFSSPIHYIQLRRARKKQKRTALHMLALSGVVRPSHVELRYATPIANFTAFRARSTSSEHSQIQPIPLRSWEHNVTPNSRRIWQWAYRLSSALIQLAKKPIVLQWAKPLDV